MITTDINITLLKEEDKVNEFINSFFLDKYIKLSLASLLLASSISVIEAQPSTSNSLKIPTKTQEIVQVKAFDKDTSTSLRGKIPTKDGTYLYGQSPQPNQLGQEYMVFEARQGKIIGAFYLPQSEFSCFQGSLAAGKLSLIMANDSSSEPYFDPRAAQNSPQVAIANDNLLGDQYQQMSTPYAVALQNYYQLSSVSASDRQILAVCKNSYQTQK